MTGLATLEIIKLRKAKETGFSQAQFRPRKDGLFYTDAAR
jgi:hypothetical protein